MTRDDTETDPNGTVRCPNCGDTVSIDENGYARCWNPEAGCGGVVVRRPCGVCGSPITIGEICADCASESDGDAFTTNWGSGRTR